jgi:phospholipid transport system transporter-binding protein
MNEGASLQPDGPGRLRLSGTLDFASVPGLLEQGRSHFTGGEPLVLDLAGVERANSAGLALLLEWLDLAGRRGQRLELENPPPALLAIARMSNVMDLLPLR